MNSLAYACAALLGSAGVVSAGDAERAIIAAMKLSEQPNYSWLSLLDERSVSYEIEGKTTPAGITGVRMPMIQAVARQLGRESDTQLEAFFNLQRMGVIRVGSDWRSPGEIALHQERQTHDRTRPMVRGSASGRFGIAGGQSVGAAAPFLEDRRGMRSAIPLPFGVTYPHEELAIIVSSHANLVINADVASGRLTDLGAALLLVRAGQADVEVLQSAGSFRFWLKNGVVIKYQLKLEGELMIGRWKTVQAYVSTTTLLKDIGTTRVNVPLEAKEKLASTAW